MKLLALVGNFAQQKIPFIQSVQCHSLAMLLSHDLNRELAIKKTNTKHGLHFWKWFVDQNLLSDGFRRLTVGLIDAKVHILRSMIAGVPDVRILLEKLRDFQAAIDAYVRRIDREMSAASVHCLKLKQLLYGVVISDINQLNRLEKVIAKQINAEFFASDIKTWTSVITNQGNAEEESQSRSERATVFTDEKCSGSGKSLYKTRLAITSSHSL